MGERLLMSSVLNGLFPVILMIYFESILSWQLFCVYKTWLRRDKYRFK